MASTYEVTDIVPAVDLGPGGRPVRVQLVTFTTLPSNLTGELRVPDADFTPELVDALAADAAAVLERVKAL